MRWSVQTIGGIFGWLRATFRRGRRAALDEPPCKAPMYRPMYMVLYIYSLDFKETLVSKGVKWGAGVPSPWGRQVFNAFEDSPLAFVLPSALPSAWISR